MIVPKDSGGSSDEKQIYNALRLLSAEGTDGAEKIVDWELQKDSESWEAWCAKADIMYLKKKYRSALECCDKSLAINPKSGLTWYSRGNILYMLKRYNESLECYNKAIEIEPLFVRAWHNKKLALEQLIKKTCPRIHKARNSVERKSSNNW